ncbi:MAG: LamG domain-containing protein [Verrucomicrobiota bacterium]
MSLIQPARIRIAADLFKFDSITDQLRSDIPDFIPKIRSGDTTQIEIAFFNDGLLLSDLSSIERIVVEIKPMHTEQPQDFDVDTFEEIDLRGPAADIAPIVQKTMSASAIDSTLTLEEWDSLAEDRAHSVITFDSSDTALAPGDRWLTISVTLNGSESRVRTVAAGPIRILGGGQSQLSPPTSEIQQFYTATQSDDRFLRQSENLADISNPDTARSNLGLGTAATADLIDEGNFASQSSTHVPTQRSVKAYVDQQIIPSSTALTPSARYGVYLDGSTGTIDFGPIFDQTMSSSWSISLSFRSADSNCVLLRKGASASFFEIRLDASGLIVASLSDGSIGNGISSSQVYNDNQWHHLALVCNPGASDGLTLYVDGQLSATGDTSAIGSLSNPNNLFLGSVNGSSNFFKGSLSEFTLHQKALSMEDISELRQDGSAGWVAKQGTANLIACHPLDAGIGYQLHDLGPNQHDGLASAIGVAHLQPKQHGFIRERGVDAYNGGSGHRELIDATRRILPLESVLDTAYAKSSGTAFNTADLNIEATTGGGNQAIVGTGPPVSIGLNRSIPIPLTKNYRTFTRRNIAISSSDPNANDIDIRVDYVCIDPPF